jgi:phosphoribosylformylglycinamidine synthase
MSGLLQNKENLMTLDFKQKGDLIFVLGDSVNCISSSEYLYSYHKIEASPAPHFDLEKEFDLQQAIKGLIYNKTINAAHDCSDGGLFVTLAEMSFPNGLGFDIVTDSEIREDAFLFGEAQSRVVVTVSEEQEDNFLEFMAQTGVNFTLLGHVTKGKFVIDDEHFGFCDEAKAIYMNSLGDKLK